MKLELGDRVKDPITGFTGIVTAITHWLNGCVRIAVQLETLKDGVPQDDKYFDEVQLRLVKKQVHTPVVLIVSQPVSKAFPIVETASHSPGGPKRETKGFNR